MAINVKGFKDGLLRSLPLIILIYVSISEFQTQFYYWKIFSFNLQFIIIYYWVLRDPSILGYGFIFICGLINDVVVGFPVGFTSINYLLICGFAAYLRNITLRPRLIQDWFFFFFTILVVNSLGYIILSSLLSITVDYVALFYNTFFTFMFYLVFANLFQIYQKAIFKESND